MGTLARPLLSDQECWCLTIPRSRDPSLDDGLIVCMFCRDKW